MSIKLIQNFDYLDYFENFSFNGNAAISTVHKFGNKSVAFSRADDSVSVSNNSGIFNINSDSVRNFECFFMPTIDLDNFNWNAFNAHIFNGHVFRLSDYSRYWNYAKADCEALGGHLATSTSQDKNNFLTSLGNGGQVWLGGTDEVSEGNWTWVTGEEWSYTNWDYGQNYQEPNDYRHIENYLSIYPSNGRWNDSPNDTNYLFICEWDNLYDAWFALNGYGFFNGHFFMLMHSDNNISWHDAKAACEAIGGHLATSTSQDKNNFLTSLANNNNVWLGGTDENNEGNWRWITGEDWSYSNWDTYINQPNNINNIEHYLMLGNNRRWCDEGNNNEENPDANIHYFICEWDYDFSYLGFIPGNIFNFDNNLSLKLNRNATLSLIANSANIDASSTATVTADAWHHLSLRINNGYAKVYLDGQLAISTDIHNLDITPSEFTLGGFSGYIDEFAVSDDTNAPLNIPTKPYDSSGDNNVPVTHAVWSCNNLPDGLTLSESGLLTGHPTVAGTYDCNFSISTNWGTANKTLRIVIQ